MCKEHLKELSANCFNPSINNFFNQTDDNLKIFEYFSEKYAYRLFDKKTIKDLVNLETFLHINYTCDYLSVLLPGKSQSEESEKTLTTNQAANNTNTVQPIVFPYTNIIMSLKI